MKKLERRQKLAKVAKKAKSRQWVFFVTDEADEDTAYDYLLSFSCIWKQVKNGFAFDDSTTTLIEGTEMFMWIQEPILEY